ncbi:DUF5034 domain-containing protein [Paraflavitalea sp. CAU 1676]|uniref:DUF5034 domain-containing protein n=1 Tax=Paraflavitalea sp. CAU 1676 TaxID=3032598 RepID=UPI0023DC78BF|nr:DUF5034 domain-containing protein [Paraflavitalea sp. CAU 1676]MDF2189553.1 DUF5034 domain-containing protein [Paraflavitalea sp. CAU 1676]
MKKVIFLLLLPLIAEVVVSCCNCVEPVIQRYTNKTISVFNLNNSGAEPQVTTADTVAKRAFGIRVQLEREKMACLQKSRSLFIQSAYAFGCRCPPPTQYRPKDSIEAIRILTLNDFDNTHLAGADVSTYFKVYKPYYFLTIGDYVKNTSPTLFTDEELKPAIDLLLMAPPAGGAEHRFRVQIRLSDGRILESDTSPIKLL